MEMQFKQLFIASKNVGKIDEFGRILSGSGIKILSTNDIPLTEIEETGTTFLENARIKAEFAKKYVDENTAVIADDAGICVDALGGRPGIYSSRYSEGKGFIFAMDKILDELKNVRNRRAAFVCELYLILPNGESHFFPGRIDGTIAESKRGEGFGYDPIFLPENYDKTFAEMSKEEKNKISHRAKALKSFTGWLFENCAK